MHATKKPPQNPPMTKQPSLPDDALMTIDIVDQLTPADLNDLCDATDAAVEAGGGFGWIVPPAREVMERYWKGVMVVPERHLLLARIDGIVCGAVQLIEPSRHNEAQAFSATLLAAFIAPWARGRGAGRKLTETAEKLALEMGYKVLQLDVRETQAAAIYLYESMGYVRWGINPAYAQIGSALVSGYYYAKTISPVVAAAKA
ncbi:MAG: GNAT family N-acetyltransferase [Alphaproteobacteria bacterium]|nr:GNAT family N-acetyltransferase [Alphaproteobacteria bacterium]